MTDVLYSGSMVMVGRGRGCVIVDTATRRVEEFDNALVPLRFSNWRDGSEAPDGVVDEARRILSGREHGNA